LLSKTHKFSAKTVLGLILTLCSWFNSQFSPKYESSIAFVDVDKGEVYPALFTHALWCQFSEWGIREKERTVNQVFFLGRTYQLN